MLLLKDIMENFRENAMNSDGLDPAHFISLPGYTWEALLKYSGIELELVTDLEMHMMIEKGLRGGICSINKRKATANNIYLDNYDSSKQSSYVFYIDKNSLYPEVMRSYIPYGDLKWENVETMTSEFISSIPTSSKRGFILDVDLEYPQSLHDTHN